MSDGEKRVYGRKKRAKRIIEVDGETAKEESADKKVSVCLQTKFCLTFSNISGRNFIRLFSLALYSCNKKSISSLFRYQLHNHYFSYLASPKFHLFFYFCQSRVCL